MTNVLVDYLAIIIPVAFGLGSALIGWLAADARSKARLTFSDEKVEDFMKQQEITLEHALVRLSALEIKAAESGQQYQEINNNLRRLDEAKASKEIVDGISQSIGSFKSEMDRRFDRIEKLLDLLTKRE